MPRPHRAPHPDHLRRPDPAAARKEVESEYAKRWGIVWSQPLGFENTFALVVRGASQKMQRDCQGVLAGGIAAWKQAGLPVAQTQQITAEELHSRMQARGVQVLDVRERGAYERGHVFRTTSLPRRQLEFRVPTLVTAPGTPIALLDADGTLARLAATTLRAMGYRDVRVLRGGFASWRDGGGSAARPSA